MMQMETSPQKKAYLAYCLLCCLYTYGVGMIPRCEGFGVNLLETAGEMYPGDSTKGEIIIDSETDKVVDRWGYEGHSYQEGVYSSVTSFAVLVDERVSEAFGDMKAAIIIDQSNNVTEDEVLKLHTTGDALIGNLVEGYDEFVEFTLTVTYECLRPGTRTIGASVIVTNSFGFIKYLNFYWSKTCGSGPRKGLRIGMEGDTFDSVVRDGKPVPGWQFTDMAGRSMVTFYLSLEEGAGSQYLPAPTLINGSPEHLSASMVEASRATTLTDNEVQRVSVFYTCKGSGVIPLSITYKLGSFDSVSFAWQKSCDGGLRDGFHVSSVSPSSSSSFREGDIYHNGKLEDPWNPALTASSSFVVPADVFFTDFWVRSELAGKTIYFERPLLTVSQQQGNVLTAEVQGREHYFANAEGNQRLRVHYRCKQAGTARITLTVVFTDRHHPVEWSWIKQCAKLKPLPPAEPHYITANKAMFIFCVTVACVGGLGYAVYQRYQQRKQQQELERRRRLQIED
ncbi:hypothetical protein QOT17_009238 [Balamuthia mandrillaris]